MPPPLSTQPTGPLALGERLRQARRLRRYSQLELAAQLDVSQRHVAFVELGRARPSRELLLRWLQALQQPLHARNEALIEAGFAPVFDSTPLTARALRPALDAIESLLRNHDPMPAFVLDHHWNVLNTNQGARWLFQEVLPEFAAGLSCGSPPQNLLQAMADSPTWLAALANLEDIAQPFLARLSDEAEMVPALRPRIEHLARAVAPRLAGSRAPDAAAAGPVLLTRLRTRHGEQAFFSLFTTFGTPRHIELESLRIEHMCAADEHTRQVVGAQVQRAR